MIEELGPRLRTVWWRLPEGLRWTLLLALFAGTCYSTWNLRWGELPATPFYPVVLVAVLLGTEQQGYLMTALAVVASITLAALLQTPAEVSQETMDSAVLALVGVSLVVATRQHRSQGLLMKHITYETGVVRALGNYALTRLSRDDLMRAVVRYLANSTDADSALLLMADTDRDMLRGYADSRILDRGPRPVERPITQSLAGEVFTSGKPRIVQNTRDVAGYKLWDASPLGSLIAVPITLAGYPIGILEVGQRAENAFTPEDLRLVETLARTLSVPLYASRPGRTERQATQADL